jgi:hypothetical protein
VQVRGLCVLITLLHTRGSGATNWSNGRLKVCRWMKKWLLRVLLNTRDLLTTGCCLRPLTIPEFQLYRAPSYRLSFMTDQRASYDALWSVYMYIYTMYLGCFLSGSIYRFFLVMSSGTLLEYNLFILAWYSGISQMITAVPYLTDFKTFSGMDYATSVINWVAAFLAIQSVSKIWFLKPVWRQAPTMATLGSSSSGNPGYSVTQAKDSVTQTTRLSVLP